MKKQISGPMFAIVIVVVVVVAGLFLFRSTSNGGVQGDGKAGNVEAAPPMSDVAKQQMLQGAGKH